MPKGPYIFLPLMSNTPENAVFNTQLLQLSNFPDIFKTSIPLIDLLASCLPDDVEVMQFQRNVVQNLEFMLLDRPTGCLKKIEFNRSNFGRGRSVTTVTDKYYRHNMITIAQGENLNRKIHKIIYKFVNLIARHNISPSRLAQDVLRQTGTFLGPAEFSVQQFLDERKIGSNWFSDWIAKKYKR